MKQNSETVLRNAGKDRDTGITIIDRRETKKQTPKMSQVERMIQQIEGEANSGSTYLLQNFGIWCAKHGLNAEEHIGDERHAELMVIAGKMAKRIRELQTKFSAITSEDKNGFQTFLNEITEEDKKSRKIRTMIFSAQKVLEVAPVQD